MAVCSFGFKGSEQAFGSSLLLAKLVATRVGVARGSTSLAVSQACGEKVVRGGKDGSVG